MSCPSSFHGKIKEIPGIAVDNFEGENLNARAYFLSHYHGDHVQGLSKMLWNEDSDNRNVFIYTSEITATIIEFEHGPTSYVKTLSRVSELITLPSVPDRGWEELIVEVTLIPAGHSFGSTMFLFKTAETTVLYTGDFRTRINDIPKYKKLHNDNGEPIAIDAMYVDTTFIGSEHEAFAKRSDTADSVIDEIDKWLKMGDDRGVSIFMFAKYTFEFIINRIYQRLNTKVYVNSHKWKLYRNLQNQVPGITNDETETRIHMCNAKFGNEYHRSCVSLTRRKYLHVHLTAYRWRNYNLDESPVSCESDTLINACFSTHCSRSEVMAFVEHFTPRTVQGFPNPYESGGATSDGDDDYILSPKRKLPAAKRKRYETARVNNVSKKIF